MMPIASPGRAIGATVGADATGTDVGLGLPDAGELGEADDAGPADVVGGAGDAHSAASCFLKFDWACSVYSPVNHSSYPLNRKTIAPRVMSSSPNSLIVWFAREALANTKSDDVVTNPPHARRRA